MKRILAGCLCVLMLLSLCGCTQTDPSLSRTAFALDTVVTVTIHDPGKADVSETLDAAFAEITRLERLLSVSVEDSDVARINRSQGQAVTVSAETAEVMKTALRIAELSDGALDVTIRPVSALWDFASGQIPDAQAIREAVAMVDYRHVSLDGNTVVLSEGAVDLGGVAKGYIADRVVDVLHSRGVVSAMIDLGGNIVAVGNKQGGAFRIGVKDPSLPTALCAVINGSDVSVVTSGIYERGFDHDGVRYHHLLDPASGMPIQNELASVTIVCKRSVEGDALSTACFVMGEQRAVQLIESLENTEALFVRRDGSVYATAGLSYELM